MNKYQITGKKLKPFKSDEGVMLDYVWYKAVRESDGVTIQFGSKNVDHEVGDNLELVLEKSESLRGGKVQIVYKEVSVE